MYLLTIAFCNTHSAISSYQSFNLNKIVTWSAAFIGSFKEPPFVFVSPVNFSIPAILKKGTLYIYVLWYFTKMSFIFADGRMRSGGLSKDVSLIFAEGDITTTDPLWHNPQGRLIGRYARISQPLDSMLWYWKVLPMIDAWLKDRNVLPYQ